MLCVILLTAAAGAAQELHGPADIPLQEGHEQQIGLTMPHAGLPCLQGKHRTSGDETRLEEGCSHTVLSAYLHVGLDAPQRHLPSNEVHDLVGKHHDLHNNSTSLRRAAGC